MVPVVKTDGVVEMSPSAGKVVVRRPAASADTAEEVDCRDVGMLVDRMVTVDWVLDSRYFEESQGSLEADTAVSVAADRYGVH